MGPHICKASGLSYCAISLGHKHISFDIKWNIGFHDLGYQELMTGEPHFLPTRSLENEAGIGFSLCVSNVIAKEEVLRIFMTPG